METMNRLEKSIHGDDSSIPGIPNFASIHRFERASDSIRPSCRGKRYLLGFAVESLFSDFGRINRRALRNHHEQRIVVLRVIAQGINTGDVKKLQDEGIHTCNSLMMNTKKDGDFLIMDLEYCDGGTLSSYIQRYGSVEEHVDYCYAQLGENGTGKTTFIRMLAGLSKLDDTERSHIEIPKFNVSYKPQKISLKFHNSVRYLLHQKIREFYMRSQFVLNVMKPLQIEQLMDQEDVNL